MFIPSGITNSDSGIAATATRLYVANSDADSTIRVYNRATGARVTADDITPAADNDDIESLYTDGTTLWALDEDDTKVYAYTISTKAQDTSKEFTLDSANTYPGGLMKVGTSYYVYDWNNGRMYVYDASGTKTSDFYLTTGFTDIASYNNKLYTISSGIGVRTLTGTIQSTISLTSGNSYYGLYVYDNTIYVLSSSGSVDTIGDYGGETAVGTNITTDISSLADGTVALCVVGRDVAGNYQSTPTTTTWTKDATAPTIVSGYYNGTSVVLTMSEPVYGSLTAGDFKVDDDGTDLTASTVLMAGNKNNASATVSLTMPSAIITGSTAKVFYTQGTNRVKDVAGNELATLAEASGVALVGKSVAVSAVSTDDVINASEDDSAVLIAGTSTGLASGTTVTVTVDDSDADLTADYSFTATTNSTGAWTTASSDLTSARLLAMDEGDLTITASASGAGSGTRTVVYDRTVPTVSSSDTGYYTSGALSTALSGSVNGGTDIYTKVSFSEVVDKTVANDTTARPVISYALGGTDTQYHIIASGTPSNGDCVESGTGASDGKQYTCRYTVGASDSGSFGVKVGTGTADAAGNALASAYTHSATLTTDTTLPTISLAIYNGSTITLTMSESVAVSGTKTGADFTVTGGGAPTVSSYAISGSTVTLTLDAAIPDGSTVTLAYAKNSTAANRIADAAGNELAAVSSQSVSEKNVSVSAVSTDDYINATEDNSVVLIAGLSAGLTTGTTITITIDDSDADTNADLTFTDTTDSTGAWTTDSSDLTVARLAALEEGDLTITASATGAGSGTRTVVYDRTVPTVSSSGTGYYTSSALDTALSGSVKTGTDIYTKVVFTDVVDETAADDATARPEISYIKTGTQYGYVPGADITLDSANSNAQGVGVVGSRLYVANDGTGAGDKVFVYDLDGTRQSGSDFGFATIDYPYGIAGHGSSYLQVLDGYSLGYIQKFNLNGTVTGNAFFNRSGTESGVTVTPTHIFTSDSGQARMYKYTHTGNVSFIVSIASGNTNGTGIAFYNDLLYIVDATDDKVYVYNTSGAHQSSHDFNLTSANSDPSGMTALANGDLLVADSVDNKLYRYSTSPPVQYDVIASGTPASGDCVESGTGASDGKQYSCRYTVASGDGGSFTVKVGTGTGDAAGNVLASAYTHGTTLTLDTAVPTILSAVHTGSTITLTMSESVAVSGTKTGADFTVTGGGAPTVSSYTISGSTVTLTLDAALTAGATVTLAYAKNATAANRITDTAGNELAAVSSQSVVEKNVSVSAVSTDDYINATEDNSAVLIAGLSAGLTTGTTVTVTIDDSDADLTADYSFTATTNSTGAWTTASSDLTSARLLAMDEGDLTITRVGERCR